MSNDLMRADLSSSGLVPDDMRVRMANPPELSACGVPNMTTPAYVIPYFDMLGQSLQFYRVKMLDPSLDYKYRQPKNTANHVYFPPRFYERVCEQNFVIITEGEKKSACAVKHGIPCVGLGGVDNWRTKVLMLPEDAELQQSYTGKGLRVRLPSNSELTFDMTGGAPIANGLEALIDFCIERNITAYICFDSDTPNGTKMEVQRAAAALGYELRFRGLSTPKIRQIILPTDQDDPDSKMGLDDFLVSYGRNEFMELVTQVSKLRSAFPRHPTVRSYVGKRLQKSKMTRRESSEVALMILSELEASGHRLKDEVSGELFYFDEDEHTLMPVQLMQHHQMPLHETPFGQLLYRRFGLVATDQRIISWMASQFTGEEGLSTSKTYKVFARSQHAALRDAIVYQISDSKFAVIRGDPANPLEIVDNGTYGILFEQGCVESLDHHALERKFKEENKRQTPKAHWIDVLKEMNFRDQRSRQLTALLFYASPWLNRWRGTQLPVELIFGEAGSGKSSLYSLRQQVLTGIVLLANLSNDIRDWYAGITSTGGLYVLDNVHFTTGAKDTRQRLSDEMCRLVTEPHPHVEMRKLYTSSGIIRFPVSATFAITSIEQPFYNEDLIQRAAILELSAIEGYHDSSWFERQVQRCGGGREGWIAHHFVVLHRFLRLAQTEWDHNFKARHRLKHYEQVLKLLAKVLNLDVGDLSSQLSYKQDKAVTETDWVLQGLVDFSHELIQRDPKGWVQIKFSTRDICNWAEAHEQYGRNMILINPWRLGKYFSAHAQTIDRVAGIKAVGTYANRTMYMIRQDWSKTRKIDS